MYLFVKDLFESKHQLTEENINGREAIAIKNEKDSKAFIDYSEAIDVVYGNSEDQYPTKKRKVLREPDDIIAEMEANKELSSIPTEKFMRGTKLNIFLVFI